MKFFGILLITMVAHTANGRAVKLLLETVHSTPNEYISVEGNGNGKIKKTSIQQWITHDDDWKIVYVIKDDLHKIESSNTSFCNAQPSSQGANVVDLVIKTLGVDDKGCPIRTQTKLQPSQTMEGELELDGFPRWKKFYLIISLMKGSQKAVDISLMGRIK